ncbi:MAG: hypothetical protein CVV34_07450 [Methanomicrobiales archaeon HGW-Methanomicrobiales-5]|nr:MAG: hypothetical protein CVV34_07450 [Methanomicrobiales archaeon HGW-Methanomicrobiales-5]
MNYFIEYLCFLIRPDIPDDIFPAQSCRKILIIFSPDYLALFSQSDAFFRMNKLPFYEIPMI